MKPVTKTSQSLHMEKAEDWCHYSLEQLKTWLAKDNGEDTKAYPDWRPRMKHYHPLIALAEFTLQTAIV